MPFLLSAGNATAGNTRPPTHHYIFLTSFFFWSPTNLAQLLHCNRRGEFYASTLLLFLRFLGVRALSTYNPYPTRFLCLFPCNYWELGSITALGIHKLDAEPLLSCLCEAYLYRILRWYSCPKKLKSKLSETSRWDRIKSTCSRKTIC